MSNVLDFETEKQRLIETPPRGPSEWEALFKRTKYGEIKATLANASLILARHEKWQGVLSYNAFARRIQILKSAPTHAIESGATQGEWWTDALAARTRTWCERIYDVAFAKDTIHEAAQMVAETNTHHPLQEYLNDVGGRWDGVPRVDTWLIDHMRVKDTPYVRIVGAKWLISAVARAFRPGCKVDYVLVIEGDQRAGKSKAFLTLCPKPEWFLSTAIELGSRDSFHVIENKWIVELAELASTSKGDIEKQKAFISNQVDTYCRRYGRVAEDQPRTIVIGASVNPPYDYMKDVSGGDRYWPVRTSATRVDRLDLSGLEEARDQIWAEAVVRFRAGEPWFLEDASLIEAAAEEQEKRRRQDPLEIKLRAYLTPKRAERGVSIADLLVPLLGEAGALRATTGDSMRIAWALQACGWEMSERPLIDGKQTRLYRPRGWLSRLKSDDEPPRK